MAEAANWALVCKKSRRFIPLELRSMFIVLEIDEILGSDGFVGDFLPVPPVCKRFFPNRPGWELTLGDRARPRARNRSRSAGGPSGTDRPRIERLLIGKA